MLKWTVIARRDGEKPETQCHPLDKYPTNIKDSTTPTSKPKRRRSSVGRRPSTSRRSNLHKRHRFSLDLNNKENQFTSTPIKSLEDLKHVDPLRDVSNLTPRIDKNKHYHERTSPLKSGNKVKKKKRCLNPHIEELFTNNSSSNFFNFEAVDSHIGALHFNDNERDLELLENKCIKSNPVKSGSHDVYAPTLPTFTVDYSPCTMKTTQCLTSLNKNIRTRTTPLTKFLATEFSEDDVSHPKKRPKIDHVNDFLHQITFLTSPQNERVSLEFKSNPIPSTTQNKVKISPLVKKFIELGFSKISYNNRTMGNNDSSYLNELSLDKIVDAILDTSNEIEQMETASASRDAINEIKTDAQARSQQHENELNETQEENLINAEYERQTLSRSSSDSGFKSSTTEHSHEIEEYFTCKCNSKSRDSNKINDNTIINLDQTYQERCVDGSSRKRSSLSPIDLGPTSAKRAHLDESQDAISNKFPLRRQRCVRRKKVDDKIITNEESLSPVLTPIDDKSFQSSLSENMFIDRNSNTSSMLCVSPNENGSPYKTFSVLKTPLETGRRFRRCLLFESPKGVDRSCSSEKSSHAIKSTLADVKGSVDLSIRLENFNALVNVIRCKDLCRENGSQINAYVKVYLSDGSGDSCSKRNIALQRTAVHADSTKPFFNHTFSIPVDPSSDLKRLLVEVWHRDRTSRSSEFLGCTSFSLQELRYTEINGSYRLLPQSTGRCQNIPIDSSNPVNNINLERSDITEQRQVNPVTMCESQGSLEEMVSIEDLENDLRTTNKTVLSEHQKSADENLFLRYLELDPLEGPDSVSAATQRRAVGNKCGRTPFTQTKRLSRPPKSGFGFSVVWTHPPRIERVEKGLPADRAGILPGDYIIFVDKHNVVMMPEIDILNVIRSYGSQLTLEIFRRNVSRNGSVPSVPSVKRLNSTGTVSIAGLPLTPYLPQRRPSTVCSTNTASLTDCNRKKLHLSQVTFSAEKPSSSSISEENRKKTMYQIISKEQHYATGLQFAMARFVSASADRSDLLTKAEHKVLFQNSDEILRITEELLDCLIRDEGEPQVNLLCRTYLRKANELTLAYKRYCSGIKNADCVLVNKTKNSNNDFVKFLQTPEIPKRRPDITTFIHKPLEHFREILKLFTVIQSLTKHSHEDHSVINQLVQILQSAYKEITAEAGVMEPVGEGRPLLTVQDLENRLVFTKCKPFVLNKPGRHWIFGGDLGRVEGRNVRQYWTLLFSDLLLFAKASRDRVLFIIEDPLPLSHIVDMVFNCRKKETEFRITVSPEGQSAKSPTVHCGPDLTRTPRKNCNRKVIVLRAPTIELKAVWQNLLKRQIFHVSTGGMDGSSLSSPLESPDVPITSSVATLQSAESLSLRRQTPRTIIQNDNERQRQIDALIEHKCKQLSKSNSSSKSNAIHLEKWMKGELDNEIPLTPEMEPMDEEWSPERLRKRSEELHLIDCQGNVICQAGCGSRRAESRCEEIHFSDNEQSPSKSTTTESPVTVRSSPHQQILDNKPVCRQCHKNCLLPVNQIESNLNKSNQYNNNQNNDNDDDWMPFLLMGLSAVNPAATLVQIDPFAPQTNQNYNKPSCNCAPNNLNIQVNGLQKSKSEETEDSPQSEEQPYHSLNSSNLTIRRFGTMSSLEKLGSTDHLDDIDENGLEENYNYETNEGIDNEAFNDTSMISSWTTRAGIFVAEKMAFFEKLGDDYRRYLTSDNRVNGDDVQEEETSGATSGEEIWGTPTSGGELDEANFANCDGKQSPNDGSISSGNNDDTELMMDELLMTPPITGAIIRGLLPRRTLEPLIEEDFSESTSSSSNTPIEFSASPEQGRASGSVADTYSTAADSKTNSFSPIEKQQSAQSPATNTSEKESDEILPRMPRSPSYRHIVDEAEKDIENGGFFSRFKPIGRFTSIERVPRVKSVKIFEYFNVRRIHETYSVEADLVKHFCKEGTVSDTVPTTYSERQDSPKKPKMDRRFWKQLTKRKGTKCSNSTQ